MPNAAYKFMINILNTGDLVSCHDQIAHIDII